jgi:alkylated DNA repair dioxygenase AlkB
MKQEKLFDNEFMSKSIDVSNNLLPNDGVVIYYGQILSNEKANQLLSILLEKIEWRQDEILMFGKKIITKRKVAWYGDEGLKYTYSKTTKTAIPWSQELLELKSIVEETTGENYNSCLLNLYHNGSEGMGFHSDDEKELKKDGAIASVSIGAERKFVFKHKTTKDKVSLYLEAGSLLLMEGTTQTYWQHQLTVSKKIVSPRINLTFRMIEK